MNEFDPNDPSTWDERSKDNYDEQGNLKEIVMISPTSIPEEKFTKEGKSYYYTRKNEQGIVEPITNKSWSLKDLAYPLNVPFGGKKQDNLGDWAFTNWLVNQAPTQLAPLISTAAGAKVLAHRRGLGKEGNVRVERFGAEGKVVDLVPTKSKVNTTQPKLKQNLDPNFSPTVRLTKAEIEAMGLGQPMQYNEGLLKSKVKETLNMSGFKSVKDIETAKIPYQRDLDIFRTSKEGIKLKTDAYTYFDTHGTMAGFPSPKGYSVRPKGKVDVKNQTGLSIASDTLRSLESKKRLFPQQPDESSILPLFQKAVGIDKAPAEASSYMKTSKKIYDEVGKAITRYNNALKADDPKVSSFKLLTKEHIFDVNFHNKLQNVVPNFSGKGANELGNLSILNLALNSKTGAKAGASKKIDVTESLIQNVKEDVGVDYNKSIGEFIDYDIGNKVKNLSKQEWDWLLEEIINSQDTGKTVQDILVESMKKLQTVEDLQFN